MIIAGLQKLSLIDYPGHICCIVFTQGCNFNCPFCHNPEQIKPMKEADVDESFITVESFFDFLESRKGKLEAVCITGGEPTLHRDLPDFIHRISTMGFKIKLDSNGYNPDKLKNLLDSGCVDYVAMDIKSTPEHYPRLMGRTIDIERIKRSVEIIRNSGIDYEFRTTCVPGLHEYEDFESIADWIGPSRAYYLQEFRPDITNDPTITDITVNHELDLTRIRDSLQGRFQILQIRT